MTTTKPARRTIKPHKAKKGCRCPWCGGASRLAFPLVNEDELQERLTRRECRAKKCGRTFYA